MSALNDLVTETLSDLVNITDAGYPGDPSGTPANNAYFSANVHPYLQALGRVIQRDREYQVSPDYASLGTPFYENIALAYAAIVSSSSSNKMLINVQTKATSYAEALTCNQNGFVVIRGDNKYSSIISGALSISTGVHIFQNIGIQANIAVTGGVAIFDNCTHTGSKVISQSGGSTMIITGCKTIGFINITGNGNTTVLEQIQNVTTGTGADASNSIKLASGMTGGNYSIRDVKCQGVLSNAGSLTVEISSLLENGISRPNY